MGPAHHLKHNDMLQHCALSARNRREGHFKAALAGGRAARGPTVIMIALVVGHSRNANVAAVESSLRLRSPGPGQRGGTTCRLRRFLSSSVTLVPVV